MATNKNEMRPTDSLRGIFALLIVWHHYAPMSGIAYSADFGNTIVLFFFMLSGFGITLSWKDKIAGKGREFLAKRCVKIFPIQWLTVIFYLIFGINIISWWAVPFHLTLTQSAMLPWQINFTMNTPSWFLSSLSFCYLFTPVILKFAVKHKNTFLFLLICAIAVFSFLVYVLPDTIGRRWLTYINPGARLLDYSCGMALALFWNNIKNGVSKYSSYGYTIVEIALIGLMFVFMLDTDLFKYNRYAFIRYPVVLGIIAVLSIKKGYVSQMLQRKWLAWLGGISMSIYMMHGFVLHFTTPIASMPLGLKTVFTYFCILAVSYIVEKGLSYCSRYFNRLAEKVFQVNLSK